MDTRRLRRHEAPWAADGISRSSAGPDCSEENVAGSPSSPRPLATSLTIPEPGRYAFEQFRADEPLAFLYRCGGCPRLIEPTTPGGAFELA